MLESFLEVQASCGENGESVQPTIFASLIAAQGDEVGGELRDERLRAPTILVNATRLLPRGLFIKRAHFEDYLVVVGGFFSQLDSDRQGVGLMSVKGLVCPLISSVRYNCQLNVYEEQRQADDEREN